jgi:hypothetical protein
MIEHLEGFAHLINTSTAKGSDVLGLSVRSVQFVAYVPANLYPKDEAELDTSGSLWPDLYKQGLLQKWYRLLERIEAACGKIEELRTLRLVVVPVPTYCRIQGKSRMMESVSNIKAVDKLVVEFL